MDDVTLHDRIKTLHSDHQHIPTVKNLPVEALTADATKAFNDLHTYVETSKTWRMPMEDFEIRRNNFIKLIDALLAQKHKCQQWEQSFKELKDEISADEYKTLEKWRKGRNKISGALRQMSIQPAVAKAAADYMHTLATSHPEEISAARHESNLEDATTLSYLSPVFIPSAMADAKLPPWLLKARTDFVSSSAGMATKVAEVETKLAASRRPQHHGSLEGILPALQFPQEDAGIAFNKPSVVNGVIHVCETGVCDMSSEQYPWTCTRTLITQHTGSCFVLLIDDEAASKHNDISAWIASCHHTHLSCFSCYNFEPGDMLLVPTGFAPVIVSLPDLDEKVGTPTKPVAKGPTTKQEYVSYIARPMYDVDWDSRAAPSTVLSVVQAYLKGSPVIPGSIKTKAQLWRTALEAGYNATRPGESAPAAAQ